MVGSPFQKLENIASDLIFMQEIKPEMIGIGPFYRIKTLLLQRKNRRDGINFNSYKYSSLIFPLSLIPATTALGTIKEGGRELGILHGANVVMPNLSPMNVRKNICFIIIKFLREQNRLKA